MCAIIEEKVSGAKQDRDIIKQLESINQQMADLVIVSELSKLSREEDVLPVLNLLNQLLKKGRKSVPACTIMSQLSNV